MVLAFAPNSLAQEIVLTIAIGSEAFLAKAEMLARTPA
jgi:hypothetical protein